MASVFLCSKKQSQRGYAVGHTRLEFFLGVFSSDYVGVLKCFCPTFNGFSDFSDMAVVLIVIYCVAKFSTFLTLHR